MCCIFREKNLMDLSRLSDAILISRCFSEAFSGSTNSRTS